jgi:cell division protein FtsB
MTRRKKSKPTLLAPAGSFIKKISGTDARTRKKYVRWGLYFAALLFLYSTMVGTYSLPRIVRLELEKQSLIEANRREVVNLIDSERVRNMLRNDPRYIEWIARTQYHMVRPGETIYRYRSR